MLWFFAWLVTQFGNIGDWFSSTATAISGIPYVGQGLAAPFRVAASFCYNLRIASSSIGAWADTVYASATRIFADIRGTLNSTYPVLTAGGSWFFDQIRGYAESYWSILTATGYTIFQKISGYCVSTWPVLTASASWFFTNVRDQIAAYWWILTASASTVATWVWTPLKPWVVALVPTLTGIWSDITGGKLQAWITTWWNGMSSSVLLYITNSWGFLITSAFAFLGKNWASFESNFAWLVTKLIALVAKQAISFATPLWGLVEAVAKKL
jgi:hypothetical protein